MPVHRTWPGTANRVVAGMKPPPPIDGVVASRLQLPPSAFVSLLDGLCVLFPTISREIWADRFSRGRVCDAAGSALQADTEYRAGMEVFYYREVRDEPAFPSAESVLHMDAHLVVADKPHGLPVTPSGASVSETLQARLIRKIGNPDLVPLHRIDRDTAGLVLFSADRATRKVYHDMFRERAIVKQYEALGPALPAVGFPLIHRSMLERGEPFFRMREVPGIPNSETRVDVIERGASVWRYRLQPVTGRKHQLRVHMAALGAPILNDRLYPALVDDHAARSSRPLQLVAKHLRFVDPLDGCRREFESGFELSKKLDNAGT